MLLLQSFSFQNLVSILFVKCTNPKSLAIWVFYYLFLFFFINDLVGTYANTVYKEN